MGQRTQIGVNIKFIDSESNEHIAREVYHYQWGGYSTVMFKNLVGFFINAKHYVENFKNEIYCKKQFGRIIKKTNFLEENLLNILKSSLNHRDGKDISIYIKDKNINEVTEEEYYNYLINYMDNNDGRIVIEILLDKNENTYCKWAFIDNEKEKRIFENLEEVMRYWEFAAEQIIEFNKIIEFIDFIGGNDIEYDSNFFKEKISKFEFKEL